jgi:hypothetical protein
MLTTAAKIRPLEEFFEPIPAPKPLSPKKEVAIPLKLGSVFCLCNFQLKLHHEIIRSCSFRTRLSKVIAKFRRYPSQGSVNHD